MKKRATGELSRLDPQSRVMVEEARAAIARAAGAHLRRLVLFGSQARGEATPESDIDLLAILECADAETVEAMRSALYDVMSAHDFSRLLSLHTRTAAEFDERLRTGHSFGRNVAEEEQAWLRLGEAIGSACLYGYSRCSWKEQMQ